MLFLSVHGFGGRSYNHDLAIAMRDEGRKLSRGLAVDTYSWDSGALDLPVIGRQWQDAKERADEEGEKLAHTLLSTHESNQVHLVGFSLGAKVVLGAMKAIGNRKCPVRAVFLLGAAVRHDESIGDYVGLSGVPVRNYYSPSVDTVLSKLFVGAEGVPAAGEVGFRDAFAAEGNVRNFRVNASHKWWGGYRQPARTVVELGACLEHVMKEAPISIQEAATVWNGRVFWDEVDSSGPYIVQRNWLSPYCWFKDQYRLVRVGSPNQLIATSERLQPVLAKMEGLASEKI